MSWWRGGYLSDSSWGLNTAGVAGVEASRDRANLVLLGIIGSKLDILCFIHTPGKLSSAFSSCQVVLYVLLFLVHDRPIFNL